MNVTINTQINVSSVLKKIGSRELWTFASEEWYRLLQPYTPHREGNLEQNVKIGAGTITYNAPYAAYVYFGEMYVDPEYKKGGFTSDGTTWWSRPGIRKIPSGRPLQYRKDHNPKASKEWDKRAIQEKQNLKLNSAVQGWIDRNI